MKNAYILLLIMSLSCPVIGQDLSIELSVSWEKGENYLKQDRDTINVPFLNVTYRNNSNESIYFMNVLPNNGGMAQFAILDHPTLNYDTIPKFDNYSGTDYHIDLDVFGALWYALADSIYFKEKTEPVEYYDFINNDLYYIYQYICFVLNQEGKSCINENGYSLPVEIKLSDGRNKVLTDQFIFLHPGESSTKSFNLIGLQAVGGNFTFCVDPNSLKNHIIEKYIWDEKKKTNIPVTIQLPDHVESYKLYYGKFHANELIIRL